jgi:hypothetical protein
MSFVPFSIDLETIISPEQITRSQFQENQIEELANLFLQARDTIKPIIVRKISPITFEVLEGYLEYYAALKAEQIDEQFTSIQAYIVPPELESTILEQYEFLKSVSAPAIADPSEVSLNNLIERTIAKQINPLKSSLQDVKTKLDQKLLASQVSTAQQSIAPPEIAISNSVEQQLADLTQTIKNLDQRIPKLPELPTPIPISNVLKDFNTLSLDELKNKLLISKLKGANLQRLLEALESIYKGVEGNSRPYKSFEQITKKVGNRKGIITENTLIKLIDLW